MTSDLAPLEHLLRDSERVLVLTGAGCSTASGIPDYRDARGQWKRKAPMSYRDFVTKPHGRRRYWARSFVGWQRFGHAEPNAAHRALASLQREGPVELLVTQNVDGLHQRAGAARVVDLHGRLDAVRCLDCGDASPRDEFQRRLRQANPDFAGPGAALAPDGDADLETVDFQAFTVPACERCDGVLKPDVVFFGESVPRARVAETYAALAQADALLVVGSSLMVFSGFRFVRRAAERGVPIAILNAGQTRADGMARVKVEAACEVALPEVATRLGMALA